MASPPLIKHIVTYGFSQILNRCLLFLLLPLFTNYLTVKDYGIISILNLILTFATSFLTLGIGTSFSVCYANETTDKAKIVISSMGIIACALAAALFIFWPFGNFLSDYFFQVNDYTDLIHLTFVTAFFASLTLPLSLHLQFQQQSRLISIITISYAALSLFVNAIILISFEMGLQGQVWATLILNILLFLMYAIPVVMECRLNCHFCWTTAKELLKHGLPIIPASFALFFLQNSQRYFLDRHSNLIELGLYTVGFNLASAVNLMVSAFSTAWTPFFVSYAHKQNEAKIVFGKIFVCYSLFFGCVSLGCFVFADPIIQLITQNSFHSSAHVVGLIALGWIAIGYYNLLNPGIIFAKKAYFNSIIQCITVGIGWVLNILLIPKYGMLGAATAFLGSQIAMLLIESGCNHYFAFFRPTLEWRHLLRHLFLFLTLLTASFFVPIHSWPGKVMWGLCCISIMGGWAGYHYLQLNRSRAAITGQ